MRDAKRWLDWLDRAPRWFRRLAGTDSAIGIGTKIWFLIKLAIRGFSVFLIPVLAYVRGNPSILWGLVFPFAWMGGEYLIARIRRPTLTKEAVQLPTPTIKIGPSIQPPERSTATKPIAGERDLQESLQALLVKGEAIKARLPSPSLMPFADPNMDFPRPDEQTIEWWEDDVLEAIADNPRWQARFQSDPPKVSAYSAFAIVMTPLQRRMEHRLQMLEEIIKRVKL